MHDKFIRKRECMKLTTFLTYLCLLFIATAVTVSAQSKLKTVQYCDLYNSTKNYEEQLIRTEAILVYASGNRVDGGDSYLYSLKCNNRDFFALIEFAALKNRDVWHKQLEKLAVREGENLFRIVLTGKFESSDKFPVYGHLSWARAKFDALEIELVKNVTASVNFPDFDAEAPLLSAGAELIETNESFVRHLIGLRIDRELVNDLLVEDFVMTDQDEKAITKAEILNKNKDTSIAQFVHKKDGITKKKNEWDASGTVTITLLDGETKTIKYKNRFHVQNGNWVLVKTEIKDGLTVSKKTY